MIEGIIRESITAWVVHNYSKNAIDCGITLVDCVDSLSSKKFNAGIVEKSFFEQAHDSIPADPHQITEWANRVISDIMEDYFYPIMQRCSFSFRAMRDMHDLMKMAARGDAVIELPSKKAQLHIQHENMFNQNDLTELVSCFLQSNGHKITSIVSSDMKQFLSNTLKEHLENPGEIENNPYKGVRSEIEKCIVAGIIESFKSTISKNIHSRLMIKFRKREKIFLKEVRRYHEENEVIFND